MRFQPISPAGLVRTLTERLQASHSGAQPLRVGFDGPRSAGLGELADAVAQQLRRAGRPVAVVDAADFYRDASVRLEHGHEDVDAFYDEWLDRAALQREVLAPVVASGHYLPALRDPVSNRSRRAEPVALAADGFLLLHGELLLGVGLPLDLTVHAAVSRLARQRQYATDWPEWAWTLPAFDRYDIDVDPVGQADVVLRLDDRARPAINAG